MECLLYDLIYYIMSLYKVLSSLCKSVAFLFRSSGFLSAFHSVFSKLLGFTHRERFCSGKPTVITAILYSSKLPEMPLSLFLMDNN